MDYKQYWNEKRPAYSHWRSGISDWDGHGRRVVNLFSKYWGHEPPLRVLDWGVGGGAVALHLLIRGVSFVIGIDISATNLAEAKERLSLPECAVGSFASYLISEPEDVLGKVKVPAIVSTAVFQHFPNKAYGSRVLRVMKKILHDDGVALIQIRYDDGHPKFVYKPELPYHENAITRCSWPLEEFSEELCSAGFLPELVKTEEHNHYAWYVCR